MRSSLRVVLGASIVLAALAGRAEAMFNLSVIDQIGTRMGGDASQQFVEIRMLVPGQTAVGDTVLGAFDADGRFMGDVLVLGHALVNSGAGVRWTLATDALQHARGFAADFTVPAGRIPVESGMICWGAPGNVAPRSDSWDHADPANYVDCVAYGRFCGASPSGSPVPFSPDDHGLTRTALTPFTDADFECSATFTPTNDAGAAVIVPGKACQPVQPFSCDSFESLGTRLDALIAQVIAANDLGRIKDGLLRELELAKVNMAGAEQLRERGKMHHARGALRHASRNLTAFGFRIRSLGARRMIPAATRATLGSLADALRDDLRALQSGL